MANVGDKFIIEIEEEFRGNDIPNVPIYDCNRLYRIKGFNSLVFDENGLNKLEKLDEILAGRIEDTEDALHIAQKDRDKWKRLYQQELGLKEKEYERGLNDAWEAARKIANMDSMIQKTLFEVCNCYPSKQIADVFENYSASEAISKIKAYEEQKKAEEEIKVGDEMQNNVTKEKGVVIFLKDLSSYPTYCLFGNSGIFSIEGELLNHWKKTGRHFDIEGILKAMREE